MPDFSRFLHVNAESTALLYELILAHRLPVRKVVVAASQAVAGEGKYQLRRARRNPSRPAAPRAARARRLGSALPALRRLPDASADRRSDLESAHRLRHFQVRRGDAGAQSGPPLRRAFDQRALYLRARPAELLLQRLFGHLPHFHAAHPERPRAGGLRGRQTVARFSRRQPMWLAPTCC